jgi:hypothetical protein
MLLNLLELFLVDALRFLRLLEGRVSQIQAGLQRLLGLKLGLLLLLLRPYLPLP